ncbi:conjugal transfer protein TraC [Bradyrhizobium sp. 142]|uniref:conjugal transfer protein TraC n=1 Tax=Bradyrhizobium sp. 142 TaxID=2782618 RepID=UPI001FF7309A|nr:conjugal transfer protein TraC [Bradyrhizobium sp. 142]MCK1724966.1 TraC family protein [Bradyrhizobium sp. 142]
MKKPSRQIRDEIARLQDQLKQAETREAERIGRIALKAGIGEFEIDEGALLSTFEEIAGRFRKDGSRTTKVLPAVTLGASSGAVEQG